MTMPHGIYKQPVEYEWKPTYCSKCLKLGHSQDECTLVIPPKVIWNEVANHNPKPAEGENESNAPIDTKGTHGGDNRNYE